MSKGNQAFKNANSDVLGVLCSDCGKKTEGRKAGSCTAVAFWHGQKWQLMGACYLPLAMADNGFASPPFYKLFKILLKCGIYSRMSTQYTKQIIVFKIRY